MYLSDSYLLGLMCSGGTKAFPIVTLVRVYYTRCTEHEKICSYTDHVSEPQNVTVRQMFVVLV